MSDCSLTPMNHFSVIWYWEQGTFRLDDGDVCFVLEKQAYLDC
jgi:hypothetical protein